MEGYIRYGFDFLILAAIITFILYIPLFFIIRKRKNKLLLQHIFNYLFLFYCINVLYITMPAFRLHGYSAGNIYAANLSPFQFVKDVLYKGNYIILEQWVLNIIMFIPLGIFVPIVFPKKINSWLKMSLIVLSSTTLIELIQFYFGRSADIDDIIANFLGGMFGFSVYVLLEKFFKDKKFWQKIKTKKSFTSVSNCITALLFIIIPCIIPSCIYISDATSEFGRLSCSSIRPNTEINANLSDETGKAMVYTVIPIDAEKRIKELSKLLDVEGELMSYSYGKRDTIRRYEITSMPDENGYTASIILDIEDGYTWSWCIDRLMKDDEEVNESIILPNDNECIQIAIDALKSIDINVDESMVTQIKEIISREEDVETGSIIKTINGKMITFHVSEVINDNELIKGTVKIYLGNNGVITKIDDSRRCCKPLKEVDIISTQQAVKKGQNAGKSMSNGIIGVSNVSIPYVIIDEIYLDYVWEREKGHLQPVWRFSGAWETNDNHEKWSGMIPAIK